jgi:hypothetical protein
MSAVFSLVFRNSGFLRSFSGISAVCNIAASFSRSRLSFASVSIFYFQCRVSCLSRGKNNCRRVIFLLLIPRLNNCCRVIFFSVLGIHLFRWSDYFRRFVLPRKILFLPRKISVLHARYGPPLSSISVRLFCAAE